MTGRDKYRGGVLGDGLERNFWEEGLPLCVQSRFECLHGCSGHSICYVAKVVYLALSCARP